jgi:hypothetical protein
VVKNPERSERLKSLKPKERCIGKGEKYISVF